MIRLRCRCGQDKALTAQRCGRCKARHKLYMRRYRAKPKQLIRDSVVVGLLSEGA